MASCTDRPAATSSNRGASAGALAQARLAIPLAAVLVVAPIAGTILAL